MDRFNSWTLSFHGPESLALARFGWQTYCPGRLFRRVYQASAYELECFIPSIDAAVSLRGIVHNYSLGSRPKSVLPSSSSLTRFGQTQFLMRPMQTERDGWIMLANGGTEKPLFLPKQYFRTSNRNLSLYAD